MVLQVISDLKTNNSDGKIDFNDRESFPAVKVKFDQNKNVAVKVMMGAIRQQAVCPPCRWRGNQCGPQPRLHENGSLARISGCAGRGLYR